MYFLIACSDEPPRSLSDLMALHTISEVGGRVGFERGAFDAAAFFGVFLAAGDAASGAAAVAGAATSDIFFLFFVINSEQTSNDDVKNFFHE